MKLSDIGESYRSGSLSKPDYIDRMHELHAALFDYAEFIRRTDIARIEITDGLVVMTSREVGIKMVCDPADKRIAPIEILNFGHYERAEAEMILSLVEPGQTVLDVGANVGWYSLNIAKRFADVSVHAFEPIPQTFDYLRRNLRLNALPNVRPHNFGFSDREAELDFYFYPEGSGNASAANLSEGESVRQVTCRVRRLDDFVAETGLRVDFIKCDVEGAELFVYRGALECLKRDAPAIFTEMLRKWSAKFGYHPNEIIGLLAGVGYRCFVVRGGGLAEFAAMDDDTVETNFLFLHSDRHASKITRHLVARRDD